MVIIPLISVEFLQQVGKVWIGCNDYSLISLGFMQQMGGMWVRCDDFSLISLGFMQPCTFSVCHPFMGVILTVAL